MSDIFSSVIKDKPAYILLLSLQEESREERDSGD
jgi:hypothetical protein